MKMWMILGLLAAGCVGPGRVEAWEYKVVSHLELTTAWGGEITWPQGLEDAPFEEVARIQKEVRDKNERSAVAFLDALGADGWELIGPLEATLLDPRYASWKPAQAAYVFRRPKR